MVNNNDCMMDSDKEEYDEEQYEVWLENEILALDVDGGTYDLMKRKSTFLNISSEAYYGGGTWYLDRWCEPPARGVGRGQNKVYGETELQCLQKTTGCPFSAEQNKEITRGGKY